MKFQGSVVKEQGITFAIVITKMHVLQSRFESQKFIESFRPVFSGMPIVLMAQDTRGVPSYLGRQDIVNFLSKIHISQIPWKEYSVN